MRDITIRQGRTFDKTWTWYDDTNTLVDLTGFTAAKMQIRREYDSDSPMATVTLGAGITLGGAAGTVQVVIPAAQTALFSPAVPAVFDIELTDSGGNLLPFVSGKVRVTPSVTR